VKTNISNSKAVSNRQNAILYFQRILDVIIVDEQPTLNNPNNKLNKVFIYFLIT